MTVFGGDIIYAADINNSVPRYVIKENNQSVTSSTTFVDDTELVTPTLAVGKWDLELHLVVTSTVAIKCEWTNTGTMANNRRAWGPGSTETDAGDDSTARWGLHGFATDVIYGPRSGALQFHIEEYAIIDVSAEGAITFRFAQNVSNAAATTVQANSYWKYKQVS